MKQWVQKLVQQLHFDLGGKTRGHKPMQADISDERATLLYVIDTLNKNLFEIERHPIRQTREQLDLFAKALIDNKAEDIEKVLFRFRQFFSAYRIDEYTYLQHTFEDFKRIIWEFADQLGEDLKLEKVEDKEIQSNLDELREAVEANSFDTLRTKSREFIDSYVNRQSRRDSRRSKRLDSIKKNLSTTRKQLTDANHSMRIDHLTGAFNRKSFDEQMKNHFSLFQLDKNPVCLLSLDIDFFKKINDSYGHDIGDFVLKECVKLLQNVFQLETDFVARVGGEEFTVILANHNKDKAIKRIESAMERIRREVFVEGQHQIRFTVSMGLAQLMEGENIDMWMKRSDAALYASKYGGRDRYTIAPDKLLENVA
jgi:diguanylate cyclase